MSFYPPRVNEKFNRPQNAGRLDAPDAVAVVPTFVCGAVLRFALTIDESSGKIAAAKFQTDGCGFLIAAADALAEIVTNRRLAELHGLDEKTLAGQIENRLEKFPSGREHCLALAIKTLQAAFENYRRRRLDEWTGEKALVCTCFGVSEERIENLVREDSAQTVEEVTRLCNAGGGCGSCQPLIQEIIDAKRMEDFF